jgi:hypothetical protein
VCRKTADTAPCYRRRRARVSASAHRSAGRGRHRRELQSVFVFVFFSLAAPKHFNEPAGMAGARDYGVTLAGILLFSVAHRRAKIIAVSSAELIARSSSVGTKIVFMVVVASSIAVERAI